MVTMNEAVAVGEAVKQRLGAGLQQFEEGLEHGRRVFARQREAAEDRITEAALHVRRHPIRSVALVAAAGAMLGCIVGFAVGRGPWCRSRG